MGATHARYEAKKAKRREYEPFVNELNKLSRECRSYEAWKFDGPIEKWQSLDHIKERLRRARIAKVLLPTLHRLRADLQDLDKQGFTDEYWHSDPDNYAYFQDPDGYMAIIKAKLRKAEAKKTAWTARNQVLKSLPLTHQRESDHYRRLTDAEFDAEVRQLVETQRRQVHLKGSFDPAVKGVNLLNMAKSMVEQGFMPVLDMNSPYLGYENVPDLEEVVQKRMKFRERYIDRIGSQFVDPEPEEGSV